MSEGGPARRLVRLGEEELMLLAAGRVDALAALHAQRDVALAALPERLSDADRERLGEAHRMQVQATALIERALSDTAAELSRLDRTHVAVRGYAASLKRD